MKIIFALTAVCTCLTIYHFLKNVSHSNNLRKKENIKTLLTASEYYMYLRSRILCCKTLDQLNVYRQITEGFKRIPFRVYIKRRERKEYYQRLITTIIQKEIEIHGKDKL
jgi:hypothetical protein